MSIEANIIGGSSKNLPAQDLELVVVVDVLKVLKQYFSGSKFELFSDHKSVRHLLDQR